MAFPLTRALACLCLMAVAMGCGGPPLTDPDAALTDGAPDVWSADAGDADPACQGLPATGRCEGDVLRSCPGGTLTERDCVAEGLRCLAAAEEPPRCDSEPGDCEGLPEGGLCVGDLLTLCHAGWLRTLDCTSLGGRCTVTGGRPGCEPSTGGARTATGTITADERFYDASGLGPIQSAPAEGVTVVVHRAADDAPLGFGTTNEQGQFSIPYDIGGGPDGVFLRVSLMSFTASHRTWVSDDADATYSFESGLLDDAGGQATSDLHVTEADDAGAVSIFGVLYRDTVIAMSLVGRRLPPLQAYWERGQRLYCGTCHTTGRIFLLGDPDDTDEYDDDVISHEFGHYLAWAVSRDDTPGGAHDGTPTDPRLAWSEGLATWIGLLLMDATIYIDTKATGATVRDPEDMGWDADPAGPLDQDVSEFMVLESLWDITDPAAAGDPMARPALDVLSVLTGYLPSTNMADRAHLGVDLVDFLDGWFCSGLGDSAGIDALVVSGQGFPYDFAGPAAPCPKPTEPVKISLRLLTSPGTDPRVRLRLVDRLGSPLARARLLLAPGQRTLDPPQRTLGATAAGEPITVTWRLPPGATPRWLRVGVTLDRGPGGVDHLTGSLHPRGLPATPRPPPRRLHLGDLLTLRVRTL